MATRPTTSCPRCQRAFEAGRGTGVDGLYCSWPCAKADRRNARQGPLLREDELAASTGRACGHCGQALPQSMKLTAIWCSPRCQREASRTRLAVPVPALEPRACDWCGEQFTPARQPLARFCCRDHAVAAANARRRDPAALPARARTQSERLADLEGRGGMTLADARFGKYPLIRVPAFGDAACRGSWLPPDAWMEAADAEEREAARHVCLTRCPHLAECAQFGVDHAGALPGIWGGMARAERTRLRAAQVREQRQQAGSAA
jgi:Transcription factor WhiB